MDHINILVSMAKRGDVEAFEKLIEGYDKKVFNTALKLTGSRDEASELAQQAFVAAFKAIRNINEDVFFPVWIMKFALRFCMTKAGSLNLEEPFIGNCRLDGIMARNIVK